MSANGRSSPAGVIVRERERVYQGWMWGGLYPKGEALAALVCIYIYPNMCRLCVCVYIYIYICIFVCSIFDCMLIIFFDVALDGM